LFVGWLVYDMPYLEVLAVIIHPVKGYKVTRLKIFVYYKLGVSQLKSERSAAPLGLAN
jgi:hypothetical protein